MKYELRPLLLILLVFAASCSDRIKYLDNDYPGLTPKKYSEGIINIEGRFQQNLTMSPDGKEYLFTTTDSELWRYESILRVRYQGNEAVIDTPQFVTDFNYENQWFIGEPMIAPDNQHLFFIADYPPDLWTSKRADDGDWSNPVKLDSLSTEIEDWYPTFSKNNTLYFTTGTVYRSEQENGAYLSKTKVESSFNQKDTRDACISPNEDYMIFTAEDSSGFGKSDLYISFKDSYGNWSEPKNLGNEINTEYREFAPYISPDERFLFFSRRDRWQNAEFSDIYWVSLEVIEKFRPGSE
ncbi:MAG: hypothetical protein ED557_03735 [Balneola sp.]|nr:MAG: hypothetical protein ED557_03735 [Balneola sp.]